jgi:kinesin family protein 2/24
MKEEADRYYSFKVSYYEIYGGKIYDLLNNHASLKLLEDKNQNVTVAGIMEQPANSP